MKPYKRKNLNMNVKEHTHLPLKKKKGNQKIRKVCARSPCKITPLGVLVSKH